MKKLFLVAGCWLLVACSFAQTVNQKLQKVFQQFEDDAQLSHAISSLYVIDAKTGKVVVDKNSQIGLAPASTQKIITSVTAFELLGKDYQYKTEFSYTGKLDDSLLIGEIYIKGSGDPTFGSWRFNTTKSNYISKKFIDQLHKQNIYLHRGSLVGITENYDESEIPNGWIWEDIGNYYGASTGSLNWNENQYDIILKPGKEEGDSVKLLRTEPTLHFDFNNKLKTGSKNSGDNAYIYFYPGSYSSYLKGTIPCCKDSFVISGAASNSNIFTLNHFANVLYGDKFKEDRWSFHLVLSKDYFGKKPVTFYTHYSPSLDSLIYWFNKKSINLYGEALIKTFAYEKQGFGSTDSGVAIVKNFWKQKGIDKDELNISDGSGLSPQNRVTTHAQVEILKYAKTRDWFASFYNSLPEYNGMKIKSGTIKDVKGFCGYHKAKDGKEYIFSFLVNNYNGPSSTLVNKMYKVLDVLK